MREIATKRVAAALMLAVMGLISALAGSCASISATQGRSPSTLVTVNGPIVAFAQDGGRIAWLAGDEVRTLATGTQATLSAAGLWNNNWFDSARGEVSGTPGIPDNTVVFTVAGERVLWGGYDGSGNNSYGGVAVSAQGEGTHDLEQLTLEFHFAGDFVTVAAGDGPTLLYSTVVVTMSRDSANSCNQGPCTLTVTGGGVKRMTGGSARALPGAPPAVAIAVSGRHVALVRASRSRSCANNCDSYPVAAANGPVEVRDAITGALVKRFSPKGTVQALALSDQFVVLLVQRGKAKRIERYDASNGTLVGTTNVPTVTAKQLSISGDAIVYRVDRAIWLLDARSKKAMLLATAGATPIGLSIQDRRVAWAENTSETHARIQAMTLPR